MARGRPGTVRTPPIILFSLLDASVRLSSLLAALFPPSLSVFSSLSSRLPLPHPFPLRSSLFRLSLRDLLSFYIVLHRTRPPPLSHPSSLSLFFLPGYSPFFFLPHVRARERVYGMSLFLPRFRCAPTLKRQLTIGAIHGLLARINCRRKLLRLCRESELSRVESERTRAVPRERCLFFGAASLLTQFYLISTRRPLGYYKLKSTTYIDRLFVSGLKSLKYLEQSIVIRIDLLILNR